MWGKKEQASAILAKYHGGGDINHPMVQLELREFEASIELQHASSVFDYTALVRGHNARWRFTMMVFMSIFAQMAGNSVLTYYLPSMYTLLGIQSAERRLLLTFMNSIVSCAGAIAGSATNDRIGRRTKLWVGSLVLAALFAGVTGFSSKFEGKPTNVSSAYSNGGVAFVSLLLFSSDLPRTWTNTACRFSSLDAPTRLCTRHLQPPTVLKCWPHPLVPRAWALYVSPCRLM